ncbi:hypothetical protein QQ045_015258 [Rhodiola kirilowii]
MKLILLLAFFFTVSQFHLISADEAFIHKVCQNDSFCINLLKSDPRSQTANASGLAKIALDKFSQNAQSALDLMKSVTKCTTALKQPSAQDDLPNCEMRFEDTVSSVPRMSAGVDQGDISSVQSGLFYLEETTKMCSEELSSHKCSEYLALVKMNDLWDKEIGVIYNMVQNLAK